MSSKMKNESLYDINEKHVFPEFKTNQQGWKLSASSSRSASVPYSCVGWRDIRWRVKEQVKEHMWNTGNVYFNAVINRQGGFPLIT